MMKSDGPGRAAEPEHIANPAPHTLEGFAILHQFFHIRRHEWRSRPADERGNVLAQAEARLAAMARREDGESGFFSQLGHKADLIALHFRRGFDALERAQRELAELELSDYLVQAGSYLSVVEIGLYEATVKLQTELSRRGVEPGSPQGRAATVTEINGQRERLSSRLWTRIPERRYLCFYPMNKRRTGQDNWYMLPLEKRRQLMHEHGLIGRRYAGQVTQIISGSIGLDDWEWGVDLFADDPLVFKKLVYEMRFDESSARYAEFGPFYLGLRLEPSELAQLMGPST